MQSCCQFKWKILPGKIKHYCVVLLLHHEKYSFISSSDIGKIHYYYQHVNIVKKESFHWKNGYFFLREHVCTLS
jgi:hypothetical protein